MATPRIGRPPVAPSKKRFSQSVTLDPPTWKKVDVVANQQGVSRSQIIDDSFKLYLGEMEDMLRHLREELSSQEQNSESQAALIKQLEEENQKLKASQQMVSSILSPYGGPTSELSKDQKEKSRTLRAIRNNPNNVFEVQMLMEGKLATPSTPILGQALQAWGSWQNILEAVKAAEEAAA